MSDLNPLWIDITIADDPAVCLLTLTLHLTSAGGQHAIEPASEGKQKSEKQHEANAPFSRVVIHVTKQHRTLESLTDETT